MNIKQSIQKFVNFCLNDPLTETTLENLLKNLDFLVIVVHDLEYEFDVNDYPENPNIKYEYIATIINNRFPNLGYYNSVLDISEKLTETEVAIGDATDDLTDIIIDLKNVLWCYKHTSEADALWHLQHSYESHWGTHARNLQLYLHSCI